MKKIIFFVNIIFINLLILTGCAKVNEVESNIMDKKDEIKKIPTFELNINEIDFKVKGLEKINFQIKKQPVTSSEGAAQYATELIGEYFTSKNVDKNSYSAIAILKDNKNKAWGVSFVKKSQNKTDEKEYLIGGGYNIAFYEDDGSIIAIWRDE